MKFKFYRILSFKTPLKTVPINKRNLLLYPINPRVKCKVCSQITQAQI